MGITALARVHGATPRAPRVAAPRRADHNGPMTKSELIHRIAQNQSQLSERTRDGIAAARKRGRKPGRPALDPETVSAAQKLIEAGLSPARAAKQLGIGRATAYRIAASVREGQFAPLT